jgi:hypothetical protein
VQILHDTVIHALVHTQFFVSSMNVCRIKVFRGLVQGNNAFLVVAVSPWSLLMLILHDLACKQVHKTGSSLMVNHASESQRLGAIHGHQRSVLGDCNSESIQVHVLASLPIWSA